MKKRKFALTCLLLAFALVLRAQAPTGEKTNSPPAVETAGQPTKTINIVQLMRDYLGKFPPGTDLPASRFEEALDQHGADALRKLGVTRVANVGNHYTVTFRAADERPLGKKTQIRYASTISFTYAEQNSTVTVSDVKGVDVKVSFWGLSLGWMTMETVSLTRDATTGNTTVVGTVSVLFHDVSHTVVLGPDGKPLDKKHTK
jgi:hypothetical protein